MKKNEEIMSDAFSRMKKITEAVVESDGDKIESIMFIVATSDSFHFSSDGTTTSQLGALELAKKNILYRSRQGNSAAEARRLSETETDVEINEN